MSRNGLCCERFARGVGPSGLLEVPEDPADRSVLSDDRDHPHLRPADRTGEWNVQEVGKGNGASRGKLGQER